MPAPLPANIHRKIDALTKVMVKPNGDPNKAAIARKVGVSYATVDRSVRARKTGNLPEPLKTPQTDIDNALIGLWDNLKRELHSDLRSGLSGAVKRFAKDANEPATDARDLRHLAQAQDVALKSVALVSGDVTSRTQQNTTAEHTHNVRVFAVPEKDTAAFQAVEGVNEQLTESYDVDEDADE